MEAYNLRSCNEHKPCWRDAGLKDVVKPVSYLGRLRSEFIVMVEAAKRVLEFQDLGVFLVNLEVTQRDRKKGVRGWRSWTLEEVFQALGEDERPTQRLEMMVTRFILILIPYRDTLESIANPVIMSGRTIR